MKKTLYAYQLMARVPQAGSDSNYPIVAASYHVILNQYPHIYIYIYQIMKN